MKETLLNYWEVSKDAIISHGITVLTALVILFIGLKIIKVIANVFEKAADKRSMDPSLKGFLSSIISVGLKIMLIVSVAAKVGIPTTSFIAVIGAAGLAVGLALQGTLANFAGGVLILILKPFKINDLINTQGEFGSVAEIGIFNTILLTPENKTVIIPNGAIMNGNITNVTNKGILRVDMTIGIAYDSDIKLAKESLLKVLNSDKDVLQDPAPFVGVSELGDSAINLAVRPYCKPEHYWDVYFRTLENGKYALDEANISIPFPQMDVHLNKVLEK